MSTDILNSMSERILPYIDNYKYLYETHMHCRESSLCGVGSAIEMCEAYKSAGYTGIVMTNHNWGGNTCVDRALPWREWVGRFFEPFEQARAYGANHDFDVFCGYEAGYDGTEFLIYGITPEWVADHPELKDATVKEQFEIVHEGGGIVIQAHPFRLASYIHVERLYPTYVDGVEGINATHSSKWSPRHDPEADRRAIEYARERKLPMTAGCDAHDTNILAGGMAFERRLTSADDFCKMIVNPSSRYLLCDGNLWYDRNGYAL